MIIGRTFDRQILDMVEVGVSYFKSMEDYGGHVPKKRVGSKPLMLFMGDIWERNEKTKRLRSFLVDFYRGDPVKKLVVKGLDHLMVFTLTEKIDVSNNSAWAIHHRTYFCKLKKNPDGGKRPLPLLLPCGPDLDMVVRRDQLAPLELWRVATKQPKGSKKKIKNRSANIFGETIGRLHLRKQDMDMLWGRKSKALRRAAKMEAEEERAAVQQELDQESVFLGQEFQRDFGFDKKEE